LLPATTTIRGGPRRTAGLDALGNGVRPACSIMVARMPFGISGPLDRTHLVSGHLRNAAFLLGWDDGGEYGVGWGAVMGTAPCEQHCPLD
jgi:hypothetical protein